VVPDANSDCSPQTNAATSGGPAATLTGSFFIGTLPKSACDYPSLELNATAKQGSSQHNLGFGSCVTGKLVQITASQGIWSVGR
jgi:hypothetical protein